MIAHRNNDTGGAACSRWPSRLTQANAAATDRKAKAYLETAEDRGHTVLHLDGKCLAPPRPLGRQEQNHSQVKHQGFIAQAGGVEHSAKVTAILMNCDGAHCPLAGQGAGRPGLARPTWSERRHERPVRYPPDCGRTLGQPGRYRKGSRPRGADERLSAVDLKFLSL